jgi:hypothetical protein
MAQLAADSTGKRIDIAAEAPPARAGTIDRAHLTRMTHGERDLEREVLELYAAQADILLGRILRGDLVQTSVAAIAAVAHTLCGSSRGVGAWQVADAAAAVEADVAEGRDAAASVERLAAAIRAAQADIAALMRA